MTRSEACEILEIPEHASLTMAKAAYKILRQEATTEVQSKILATALNIFQGVLKEEDEHIESTSAKSAPRKTPMAASNLPTTKTKPSTNLKTTGREIATQSATPVADAAPQGIGFQSQEPLPNSAFNELPDMQASRTFQSYEERAFGLVKRQTGPSTENWDVALAPDERTFLLASASGVYKWDIVSGELIHPKTKRPSPWPGHSTSDTYGCDISSNGQRALTANASGEVFLWDYQTGDVLKGNSPIGKARKVKFVLGDRKALSVSWDGPTVLWDLHSASPEAAVALESPDAPVGRTSGLVVSEDGNRAFIVGRGLSIHAWDLQNRKLLWSTEGSYSKSTADNSFARLSISTDEKLALIGYDYGMMWIDLSSKKVIQEARYTGYTDFYPVSGAAISNDGSKALTASKNDLLLWDMSTRRPIKRLKGHTSHPTEIRFSRDGSFAISTSHDHTVKLWRF